ncbi:MAG: hypothetical protein R2788_19010 [Saprospiraceae bacterium]
MMSCYGFLFLENTSFLRSQNLAFGQQRSTKTTNQPNIMADNKIIFSMSGVSKTFPGAQKPVIKNIWLSL